MSAANDPQRRSVLGVFLAILIAATLCPALATEAGGRGIPDNVRVEAGEGDFEILRFERSLGADATIAAVRVRNPWGDIRVRRTQGPALELAVVIQRLGAGDPLPDIGAALRSGRVEVRVDYPGEPRRVSAGGQRPGRVDLVVLVPPGASIDVATDDGEVRIGHALKPIRARSVSGRILASGASTLDISSETGHVLARQVGGINGRSRVASGSGSVSVLVSPTGSQRLRIRAGAGIFAGPGWGTEHGLDLPPGAKRFEHRWGEGRYRFDIESREAEVYLMPFIALDGSDAGEDLDGSR